MKDRYDMDETKVQNLFCTHTSENKRKLWLKKLSFHPLNSTFFFWIVNSDFEIDGCFMLGSLSSSFSFRYTGCGIFNVSSCYAPLLFSYSWFGRSHIVMFFQFELDNDGIRDHFKTISITSTWHVIGGLLSLPQSTTLLISPCHH